MLRFSGKLVFAQQIRAGRVGANGRFGMRCGG